MRVFAVTIYFLFNGNLNYLSAPVSWELDYLHNGNNVNNESTRNLGYNLNNGVIQPSL